MTYPQKSDTLRAKCQNSNEYDWNDKKVPKCTEKCENVLKCVKMYWNEWKCTELYWNIFKCTEMYSNVSKCKQSSLCSLCCKLRLFGRFYKRKMSKSQYVNHLFGPVSNSKNTLVSALCTEQKSDALFSPPCTTFFDVRKTYFKLFCSPEIGFTKFHFFLLCL